MPLFARQSIEPPCLLMGQAAALVLSTSLVAMPGWAAEADAPKDFQIPAQSLQAALAQLADQADLKLSYPSDLIKGLKTAGVTGRFTPQEAMDKLLNGTGLVCRMTANHAMTLEKSLHPAPAPEKPLPQSAVALPKVTVKGRSDIDHTDPYDTSYVIPNATAGTKTDTPIMETPVNVQVVSKQVLKDQQVIRLADAFKNVSGVTLSGGDNNSQAGLGDSVTIRGFSTQALFRNGFRMDSTLNAAGSREMANVESIEILKGPAAILYGRVEPGGMVNIVTKQALATPYYALQQQFGSYDLYRTSIDATGPLTKGNDLLYRLNLSYESSKSFRDLVDTDKLFIAPVLKWNIGASTTANFEFEYNRDSLTYDLATLPYDNRNRIIRLPRTTNLGEYYPSHAESYLGAFNIRHEFNDDWALKYAVTVKRAAQNANLVGINYDLANRLATRSVESYAGMDATYATELNLTGHFDTGFLSHTLLLGGDYYRWDYSNVVRFGFGTFPSISIDTPIHTGPSSFIARNPSPLNVESHTDNFGAYFQDQIKLPYNVQFLGGFRYQNIHQPWTVKFPTLNNTVVIDQTTTSDAVTPRVGLLWQPRPWLTLYGNYVENFGSNWGNILSGNRAPPPTTAQQWEFGTKAELFDGRLQATLAYYDLTKQNVAVSDPRTAGEFAIIAGEINSRGPELDIKGEILPGWNVIATYANQDVRVTQSALDTPPGFFAVGSRMSGVPRNIASLWSTYEFLEGDLKGFKWGGGVSLRDGVTDATTTFNSPGYATVDLLAAYSLKLGKAKLTAQLNVNNLLNKEQFTTNTAFGGSAFGSFLPPRSFLGFVKLEY